MNKPECQWNGPSWPFQTTLALGGMANLLERLSSQNVVGADDYVRLLQQYAQQHYLNGQPDLQEDYNPDTGDVIVGLPPKPPLQPFRLRRPDHHRPGRAAPPRRQHPGGESADSDRPEGRGRPRATSAWKMCPTTGSWSRSSMTVTASATRGRGSVGLGGRPAGREALAAGQEDWSTLPRTASRAQTARRPPCGPGRQPGPDRLPHPSASANNDAGRLCIRPSTGASGSTRTSGTTGPTPGRRAQRLVQPRFRAAARPFSSAQTLFLWRRRTVQGADRACVQYWTGQGWADVPASRSAPARPVENGETTVTFSPVRTSRLRAVFTNPRAPPSRWSR